MLSATEEIYTAYTQFHQQRHTLLSANTLHFKRTHNSINKGTPFYQQTCYTSSEELVLWQTEVDSMP